MGRDRRGSGKKQYPIPEGTERTELAAKSWETVLEVQLRVQLFESAFNMWVTPLQLIGQHENRLVLAGPGPIRTWVLRRYAEVIGDAIRDLTDFDGAILCDLPAEPANRGWI